MNTTATVRRIAFAALALLVATVHVSAADDERTKLDCGVNALYLLLHLQGRPVTVEQVLSKLPARHPDGYSMAELAAASEALGLPLRGVRFAMGDSTPDQPAIAFLESERGGHFTVLRPLGTTGTMVQVIDPPIPPWVTDYDRLFVNGPWTDRILLPQPLWYLSPGTTIGSAMAGAAIAIASAFSQKGRGRSSSLPSAWRRIRHSDLGVRGERTLDHCE